MPYVPVTVAMVRRTAHEQIPELVNWAQTLCQEASRFPGYLSHSVTLRRAEPTIGEVVIAMQFSTAAELVGWEGSPERARLLARGEELTDAVAEPLPLSELTHVAQSSGNPIVARLRAVAVVWTALFLPILLLNLIVDHLKEPHLVVLRTLGTTLLIVPLVVLVTVPLVERTFAFLGGRGPARVRKVKQARR